MARFYTYYAQMLFINIKKIKTNFSFNSAINGVAKIASKEIFCYARNFFPTVRSRFCGINKFLLG